MDLAYINYNLFINNIMSYYYHGSTHKLNILKPRNSKVIDNEKAVFATNNKDIAVIFIPKWTDCDIDLGFYKGIPYASEQYPDAFNKLKDVSGYLYYVPKDKFNSDNRLGMKRHEFICRDNVKVQKTEEIKDVYKYLKKSSINLVTYSEKLDSMYKFGYLKKK